MGALYTIPEKPWPRLAGWLVPGYNCTELQFKIVERAFRDVGICEDPPSSNRGTRLDSYAKRSGVPVGSWWCALWVGCVWADAGAKVPKWFPMTDHWIQHLQPKPVIGAAILYGLKKRGPVSAKMDAHHIGIVVRIEPTLLTIEGNRSWAGTASNNGEAVDIGPVARRDILGYIHPVAA